MTDRGLAEALEAAGDPAGAVAWRRLCRELDGGLRVGLAARDLPLAGRLSGELPTGVRPVPIAIEASAEGEAPVPTLGAEDALLGTHALLWVTPITAALGAHERAALTALDAAGAPERRAVVLADVHLLERLSDEPEREAADVRERVGALLPPGWALLEAAEVQGWLAAADAPELRAARREVVGRRLLAEARARLDAQRERIDAELARVDALLSQADEAIAAARREGERAAAHLFGAMRRHTEDLLVSLGAFLVALEEDLPAQIAAIPDVETVRRALPHWLQHVAEGWMTDHLAAWRAAVLRDLHELRLADDDLARAELLVPGLHPAPVRGESTWTSRLVSTAAVGGGAALLVLGLWVPGLLALGGGLAWSAVGRAGRDEETRKKLVETAIDAVRALRADAERLLREQLTRIEGELAALGGEREEASRARGASARAELEARRASLVIRRADLLSAGAALA